MLNFLAIDPAVQVIFIVTVVLLLVIVISSSVKIIPQAHVALVERFGKYKKTLGVGIWFTIPFVDRLRSKISLKEKIGDFPPQPVITKDNVTMQIDTVIYYRITDAFLFTYNVEHPISAIEKLTATTLRNIIGELELDETLTSRDTINDKMRLIIDEATDPWGIKITRVELKNIIPPRDIQESMEKQMRAERERREAILRAEGEKRAAILTAEGAKESKILQAEGAKESEILKAEADRQALIARASGEAEAILKVYEAQAAGIKLINQANPSAAFLSIKGYEALEKLGLSPASKIIIPSEIQGAAGAIASLVELAKPVGDQNKKTEK
jgi:regulator of protease activity HflC (stomatin/prohibitin superfamily)